MKFMCPMLVVTDMERSKEFYKSLFSLEITLDFGANVTFGDAFALQTQDTWAEFIGRPREAISYKGNDAELYFEEEDMDEFLEKLKQFPQIEYVHPLQEHDWGQRVARFYDPDGHIIEVGESMVVVCKRFLDQGMSVREVAKKTMYPEQFVESLKGEK